MGDWVRDIRHWASCRLDVVSVWGWCHVRLFQRGFDLDFEGGSRLSQLQIWLHVICLGSGGGSISLLLIFDKCHQGLSSSLEAGKVARSLLNSTTWDSVLYQMTIVCCWTWTWLNLDCACTLSNKKIILLRNDTKFCNGFCLLFYAPPKEKEGALNFKDIFISL